MATINSLVDLVHPAVSGVSIFTTDQPWVLFNREMDETTLSNGCYFITGPDFDTFTGPDLQIFQEAASSGSGSDDILESPGFEGIVKGDIVCSKISLTNPPVTITGVYDYSAAGNLWRTKLTFIPKERLQANTWYHIYITGQEDDTGDLLTGISSRTVFDTVVGGSNSGTGVVTFDGGYIGLQPDTFYATITTAGGVDTAKFTFTRQSDPDVNGPFTTRMSDTLLGDCVIISFSDGYYQAGDTWSVKVVPRTTWSGNIMYPFQTGSADLVTLPPETSTTILGDIPAPAVSTTAFQVVATYPTDDTTNLTIVPGPLTMKAIFNTDILASTVHSGVNVTVMAEDIEGAPPNPVPPQILVSDPQVSGNTLSITINSGVLQGNHAITVTLNAGMMGTNGYALAKDYSWTFTTTYSPMYTTSRRIRVLIGNYIQNISDDTVNYAIYIASLMAEQLTWNKQNLDDAYYQFVRQQWTQCKAEEILLMNIMGGPTRLRGKTLGDLSVEYQNPQIIPVLDRALQCQQQWVRALLAGGRMIQKAEMVVKGGADPDRPPIGRGWYHVRNLYYPQTPVANQRTEYAGHRRYRGNYSFAWWNVPGWWSNR